MINNAKSGDVIELEDKVYNEWNIRVNKNVTIKAKAGANPIVNGNKKGSVFVFSSDAVINGITVIGGLSGGAGVYNDGGSIINCTTKNNIISAERADGAGVYNNNGSIIGCIIQNNEISSPWYVRAESGGGVYNNNGFVTNCMIMANTADRYGGGIYNNGVVTDCNISDNDVSGYKGKGSGIYNDVGSVIGCNIMNNKFSGYYGDGGGVYGGTVKHCNITKNEAYWGGGVSTGKYVNYNRIYNNSAYPYKGDARDKNVNNDDLAGNYDFNWWGTNDISKAGISGDHYRKRGLPPNNHYVVKLVNKSSTQLKYDMVLNDSSTNVDILPSFNGFLQ